MRLWPAPELQLSTRRSSSGFSWPKPFINREWREPPGPTTPYHSIAPKESNFRSFGENVRDDKYVQRGMDARRACPQLEFKIALLNDSIIDSVDASGRDG